MRIFPNFFRKFKGLKKAMRLIAFQKKIKKSPPKIAVHLHLYYTDLLDEFLAKLHYMPVTFDLFVTLTKKNKALENKIRKAKPQATVIVSENRGKDIGGFVDFLHHIQPSDYDFIIKLQTKKNVNNITDQGYLNWMNYQLKVSDQDDWRRCMTDAMIGTQRQALKLLYLFSKKSVGMVGAENLLIDTPNKKPNPYMTSNMENYVKVSEKLGLPVGDRVKFFVGTSFAIRGVILEKLKKFKIKDFKESRLSSVDGEIEHSIERIFGSLVENQGYVIKTLPRI